MKKNKGISLIVLVITIIVIIILATAILVSILSNNPISEANKARYESDRDNMQAVFTNTVGKIMAENQGVVNVTAGQINTEISGVNETTGEVAYTVDNATVAANASGTIIFDKGTNDATTYYTGKKLPIYAAGETKWYVDTDGVISLEVAGVKYGSGELVDGSEEVVTLAAGLYDENDVMTASWYELVNTYGLDIENDHSAGATGTLNSVFMIATMPDSTVDFGNDIKFVVNNSVTTIGEWTLAACSNSYGAGANLVSIVIPNSVTSIKDSAFYLCDKLNTVYYTGTQEQWDSISILENNDSLLNAEIIYNYVIQ